ncbi:phosphotransferase [Arsukibacterium indicum]|uniref:Phosphotransferase n=1 Tax=Arsukibacterium indicum TaxID=2848612 RepID=A0ABS6MN34_9GAMM|nr:phosphotransferase [Arsukibacterium indicum]MBV2130193.1 phosphotransferase [Arsukibacterium indicum]
MAGELSTATPTGAASQITALCRHLEFFAGHPPLAISPLSNGDLNLNYRVETRRGLYAVRRYPVSSAVCRQQELRCQHAAAVAGIAPAPLCLNNHLQVLISEFIADGEEFLLTGQSMPILASTLATLHQLPVQTAVLQPVSYLHQLVKPVRQALDAADQALFKQLLAAAKQYQALPADLVLCHLDLHAGNMLWADDALWLLDFEYAQLADSCLDLAAVSLNFQLSDTTEQTLMTTYRQHRTECCETAALHREKLLLAKAVFSGFCWLWYLKLQVSLSESESLTQHWRQQLAKQLALQSA